jgi:hypothetical protein
MWVCSSPGCANLYLRPYYNYYPSLGQSLDSRAACQVTFSSLLQHKLVADAVVTSIFFLEMNVIRRTASSSPGIKGWRERQ